ncbi:synaptotagmin-1-like [Watersipora subatra]|uniref:synaptotagmin-1-like n=1 Tax=Watersipora subatra TaxID=2589382 RepID=UPI00355BD237
MSAEQTALYGGIIAVVVTGFLIMLTCLICKFCLNSNTSQRLAGLIAKASKANDGGPKTYNKNIVSQESDLMLRMQRGDYVGYDAVERGITITQLPVSVSKEGLQYSQQNNSLSRSDSSEDNLDMTVLKSSYPVVPKARSKSHSDRPNGYTFHTSYTIYEESSDISGNESGAWSACSQHSSELQPEMRDSQVSSESTSSRSESCKSLDDSLALLHLCSSDAELGQVEYSLQYHRDEKQLVLHIIQARELDIDFGVNSSLPDTFIKTFASDCNDHDPKKQTKICKTTANPVFNERFIFCVEDSELATASITLQVFTRDHYARQKLVGEICAELHPLLITDAYRTWSNILDYDHQPASSCADVKVSLMLDTSLDTVNIRLLELRSLKLQTSPLYKSKVLYMNITLVSHEEEAIKRKTKTFPVKNGTSQLQLPDQSLVFHSSCQGLQTSKLLIELCEELPDKSQHTIGYTILGSGTSDTECGHWLLMNNPNIEQPVTMWHCIHLIPVQAKPGPPFTLR